MTTTENNTGTNYSLTREDWLRRAAKILSEMVFQVSGVEVPDFHVSMGFGGVTYERKVRGVCWKREVSDDGKNHVFISPEMKDPAAVLLTLLHEILHVADDCQHKHAGKFAEWATRLEFEAPFNSSKASPALAASLLLIVEELGDFPHAGLNVPARRTATTPVDVPVGVGGGSYTSGPAPQTNRWISFGCPVHNTPVRMSRTKAALGAPYCGHREHGVPCLREMTER